MTPIFIFAYFLLGLWSAERFRERSQDNTSWGVYAAMILFWPAFWIMDAIGADIPETDKGDDNDAEGN